MPLSYAVITATLNAAEHLGRAMDSVLAQAIQPAEYVVIDGGSVDGTIDEAHDRAERARRQGVATEYRIVRQSSPDGIAGAWNEAIRSVRADVVFLLNADDWFEPHTARSVLRAFHDDPSAGIVHAKARFLRSDGSVLGICAPAWINRVGLQCRTVHCATFVRREVYERVGGFDANYRTTLDFDFLERCWHAGVGFRYLDELVTNFRLGGVSNPLRTRADWEALVIGLRHSKPKVPPVAAFVVRKLLMRPFGLAGFNLRLRREVEHAAPANDAGKPAVPAVPPAR